MSWISAKNGNVPDGAICAGNDHSAKPIYVSRAHHNGDLVPGKLVPHHGTSFVAWGGLEHTKSNYEVLCHLDVIWVPMYQHSALPEHVYPAGYTAQGEHLYVGRANHAGTLQVGKVHFSHQKCYISYGGQEIAYNQYEIMTLNIPEQHIGWRTPAESQKGNRYVPPRGHLGFRNFRR